MKMSSVYKGMIYLIGIIINFLGVSLIVKSGLGAGFWAAFFTGLSEQIGFTVGTWYGLFQFLFIFVNGYLVCRRPEFLAFIPLVLETIVFDFWLEVVFSSLNLSAAPLYLQLLVFASGIFCVSLGVALYILPGFPRAPIDQLFLAFSERFNWNIRRSQTLIAILVAAIAFFVGGPVGIGTVIVALSIGTFIQFWYEKLAAVYQQYAGNDMMSA
ncbi:YczE/YyaS/YitT family protein [Salibacterium sp. K-3]